MPYIDPDRRDSVEAGDICTPGELNYAISVLVARYLRRKGALRYSAINEVMGVLACARDEFYRRVAVPYEDEKLAENGDVY